MIRLLLIGLFVAGCVQPSVVHCPDVDCPTGKVCDGVGGCALPEQLAVCVMAGDGASCSYSDATGTSVSGECVSGVCFPVGCGNGFVTPPEACDDGNNVSGDGCSAD